MAAQNPTEITWSMVWRELNRLDKVLLALLAAFVVMGYVLSLGMTSTVCQLATYITGFWLVVRVTRRFLQHILWRLRNRLLVAYGFIAVVPILLILTFAGLLLYAIVGQTAVFLVTNELERNAALMVSTAQHIAESELNRGLVAMDQAFPILNARLPGLEILVEGGEQRRMPASSTIAAPPKEWGDAGGLTIKDGALFAWAHIVRPGVRVTLLLPMTDRFLAGLAPNIGEIAFYRLDEDLTRNRGRLRLKRSSLQAEEVDAPKNQAPPKERPADIEVRWGTALPAYLWDSPGRVEFELLRIVTRPSAVIRTVFAQKVDVVGDAIPAALLLLSISILLAEVTALIVGVSITRTITGTVHDLYQGTERVKEGDFSHRIQIKGQDQLADLGVSFNDMTANIERLLVVAKENERIAKDLEVAKEVQAQLYPRIIPSTPSLELRALCNPARMVSGDYYDYQRLDEFRITIAIGDVAGKGISAALLMATVQSALRTQVGHCMESMVDGEVQISTSKLVSHLNKHLFAHTTPEKYATFCLGVYDEQCHTLTYTNAGHLPPILFRNGETSPLEVNGTVVGAFPFSRYEESKIELIEGDMLLFYTDGISEAENEYGEQYGEERLGQLLSRSEGIGPEKVLSAIVESVQEWTGSAELQDDMTLLLAVRH